VLNEQETYKDSLFGVMEDLNTPEDKEKMV